MTGRMTGRTQQRGIALVMSYLLIALVTAYGSAMMVQSLTEQRSVERFLRFSAAFQAAEAGLDSAITQFKTNPNWTGATYTTALKGGYEVTVTNLSPTIRKVEVSGYYPSNATSEHRHVEGTIWVEEPLFNHAAFSATTVQMDSNTRIDSYDSSLGAYNAGTAGSNGNVGSNSTGASTINLASNAKIKGDAAVGPGGNVNTDITLAGNASISGSEQTLVEPKDMMPQSYPGGIASAPLEYTSNQQATLSGGTYTYSYVHLDSNAKVEFTGNATIYVDQYFTLDSNATFKTSATCPSCTLTIYVKGESTSTPAVEIKSNASLTAGNDPTQLTFYVTGASTSSTSAGDVIFSSNNGIYGAIHAPISDVTLNSNVVLYGAVVGYSLDLDSNVKVHYDKALEKVGGPDGGFQTALRSWREL